MLLTPKLIKLLQSVDCNSYDFNKLAFQIAEHIGKIKFPGHVADEIKAVLLSGNDGGKEWKKIYDLLGEDDFSWYSLQFCKDWCDMENISYQSYDFFNAKPDKQKRERCKLLVGYVSSVAYALHAHAQHLQRGEILNRRFKPVLITSFLEEADYRLAEKVTGGKGYDGVIVNGVVQMLPPLFPGDQAGVEYQFIRNS